MDISYIKELIKPELLVLIPVLYFIGMAFKHAASFMDKYIPITLGLISIALSVLYLLSSADPTAQHSLMSVIFTGITQGILCAGGSVYIDQLIKQTKKE